MARKTALIKTDMTPIEQAWARHEVAQRDHHAAWAEVAKMSSDVTESGIKKGVTQEQYDAALKRCDVTSRVLFQTFDGWHFLDKHKDDPPPVELIPHADLLATAKDTIEENLDNMQFTVNFGLLASKVAAELRPFASEDDSLEAPFCGRC